MKKTPAREQSEGPLSAVPDYLIRYATLRQLQVFEAIVRLGSFTRAAEELFLTQPTVSMQVKKLADVMGLPLFEHVGRSVRPTEAGLELHDACRKMFETLTNLEMKLADLKGMKRGRLRLGVITTAEYFAPEILGEYSQLYPGIEVSLKVTNRDSIIGRMHNNEDDLYIMGRTPTTEVEVVSCPLAPNPIAVMAPRNHPLVGKANIPLERLAEEPFILREPGSGIRDATLRLFEAAGLRLNVRMELGSNEAIKHAIVGGLGISVLSLHTLTLERKDGPVAILDVKGFPILRYWYLVYPKGKELSLVARTFLDFAAEHGPRLRERLEAMWPALRQVIRDGKAPDYCSDREAAQ
ncbi:MAG: LysR family transcriptional regulator [Gammaproteobacteria bacterium]|nr:LysR family transcriptional regulator [Gammaproteobacteria bacterium]MDJ0871101.1 LysR family transcriptional regulator [Gammaproteobacteria bacterium]MDJ0892227.1 LysR family transcriptional regulator [Gammaproteobacteria bacterium]